MTQNCKILTIAPKRFLGLLFAFLVSVEHETDVDSGHLDSRDGWEARARARLYCKAATASARHAEAAATATAPAAR